MAALARWAGWIVLIVIAFASLLPGSLKPHVTSADKVEHFVAYLIAGALLAFGWHRRSITALVAVILTAYAAAMEVGQLFVSGREASFADFVWSAAGAWCGVGAAWLLGERYGFFAHRDRRAAQNHPPLG